MSQSAPVSSILEFLTHPNPQVKHKKPKSNKNTTSKNYYFPRQLLHWDEFDIHLLKTIYGGSLFQALRHRGHALPSYPTVSRRTDLKICKEKDTRSLIRKWNETIVTAALEPIQHEFHPAIWAQGEQPEGNQELDVPQGRQGSRVQPPRASSKSSRTPKKQSLARLRPDCGSSAWYMDDASSDATTPDPEDRRERFPKEYKVSTKWKSKNVVDELLDESGEWEAGNHTDNLAMPINQAFTYCLANRCRYGCILTCEEAFIFRVRPRSASNKTLAGELSISESEVNVVQDLITDGLMEYISIPWTNHCRPGDVSEHMWTVNLALWFVHILAGNHFEVAWEYIALGRESVRITTPPAEVTVSSANTASDAENEATTNEEDDSDGTDDTVPMKISPLLRKRKLEALGPEEEEDAIHMSFSKRSFT